MTKKSKAAVRTVRTEYNPDREFVVKGHDQDWVEYDVSEWTARDFRLMSNANPTSGILTRYLENDSVNWHLTGTDGSKVKHPGRGADPEAWLDAYDKIEVAMMSWINYTPWMAMQEACVPPKKSSDAD